jgi:hypothetical protein
MNRNPKYVTGDKRMVFMGYRKCSPMDNAINAMK